MEAETVVMVVTDLDGKEKKFGLRFSDHSDLPQHKAYLEFCHLVLREMKGFDYVAEEPQ